MNQSFLLFLDIMAGTGSVAVQAAKVDGNIQFAISLLSSSLNDITRSPVKDFNFSIQYILKNWNTCFPDPRSTEYIKYFRDAKLVRHRVAHQGFNLNEYMDNQALLTIKTFNITSFSFIIVPDMNMS